MHGNSLWLLFDLEVYWTWMCLWQILWDLPVTSKKKKMPEAARATTFTPQSKSMKPKLYGTINKNCKCLKPKLTCYTIIGVLGFSFEFKTLSLLPVHVHVRLCWVAISLPSRRETSHTSCHEIHMVILYSTFYICYCIC